MAASPILNTLQCVHHFNTSIDRWQQVIRDEERWQQLYSVLHQVLPSHEMGDIDARLGTKATYTAPPPPHPTPRVTVCYQEEGYIHHTTTTPTHHHPIQPQGLQVHSCKQGRLYYYMLGKGHRYDPWAMYWGLLLIMQLQVSSNNGKI